MVPEEPVLELATGGWGRNRVVTGHHCLWLCHVPWVLLCVDFIPGAQSRGSLMAVPGVHSEKLDLSCGADRLAVGRRQWIDQQPGCLGLTWGDRLGCP